MWSTWARPPSSAELACSSDGRAGFRDRDGGVPVEVVGEVAQGADEGPARRGRWCSASWRFLSGVVGQATAMAGPAVVAGAGCGGSRRRSRPGR